MRRILIFIFAFIFGLFLAGEAFGQPVQEIDPRSIWRDGSKVTTARIPFAYGISMTPNIMIGVGALTTAGPGLTGAIAIGSNAGQTLYGDQSIAIGTNALQNTASGAGSSTPNMAIGTNALRNLTTASNNLAYGYGALTTYTTSTLGGNIGIGNYSLENTSNAETTICIGYRCGNALTTHDSTVALGYNTLASMTSGGRELVAVGYESMSDMTAGIGNTAVGYGSMSNVDADYAVAVGYAALWGDNLPTAAIIGDGAVMIGYRAGQHLFGPYSIGIGYGALSGTQASGAANNVAIGKNSLAALTTGNNNLAVGQLTGTALTTGTGNVFLGNNAGYYETGSSKLFIDNATRSNEADARTKALVYGVFDSATANQRLTINGVTTSLEGLVIPQGEAITFGADASISTDGTYLYFNSGFATNQSLKFAIGNGVGNIVFEGPGGQTYYYASGGIEHLIPSTAFFSVQDAAFGPNYFRVDPSANRTTSTLPVTITNTSTSAFLVENGSGTDRFLVDTSTPKIDLLANTNLGVSASTGYNLSLYTDTASKGLFWTPNASSSNPVFQYAGKDGRDVHLEFGATATTTSGSWSVAKFPVVLSTTAKSVAQPFYITITDGRTITGSGIGFDAMRGMNFTLTRNSSFSSNQTGLHQMAGLFFSETDNGTYTGTTSSLNSYGVVFEGSIAPSLSGSSTQAYTYNGIEFGGSGLTTLPVGTNGANSTFNFSLLTMPGGSFGAVAGAFGPNTFGIKFINIAPSFQFIGGTRTITGFNFVPTFTAGGSAGDIKGFNYAPTRSGHTWTSEYAVYASSGVIGLIADGSSSDVGSSGGAGGGLIMGASSDWKRYYEADNEAVEDIPTGAVYDFRINAVDQMSLSLRNLNLGDNTANDFNIAFDQSDDASIKWDNADETIYIRTNGAPEYLYPTYEAGVSITTYGESSPTARYALQAWGIPSAAFGSIGGFWGGFSENGSSTGYGGTEVYGGTFYNYFTGTNSRTITSIFGNYVGNEFNVVSAITTSNLRGIYVGVAEGTGSLTTATTITGLEIAAPTVTFTGATPTTYYGLRLAAYTGATTNYSAFINGAGILGFRNANHTISSPSSGILRVSANTTINLYAGGVASGFDIATFSTTAITVTDAINMVLGTTTGTKFGTATTQLLSFWNATPIVQPANTVAINDVLVNTGLRASGGTSNFTSAISTNNDITSSDTGDLGWAVVDGTDNTACTSQCTSAAVFGLDLAAGATAPVIVGATNANADICLCAGSS